MGANPTKARDNIYCRYRKMAAKYNDKLHSREGAAELLGVSVSSLADYELGNTKIVPVDKVNFMADLYNAPELRQWYCATECPLGKYTQEIGEMPAERALLRLKNAIKEVNTVMDTVAMIMDDGKLDEEEKPLIPNLKAQLLNTRQRFDENIIALERAERLGRF